MMPDDCGASGNQPMFYELATSSWGQEELDAIQSVIDSDRFTMGPRVAEFERRFAAYLGKRFAVMVNSGSSANLISVASLFYKKERPLQRGDEAIVPAVSWSTTYHPLQQYGLKMRIVDVDLDTLNIDVDMLEQALTPRPALPAPPPGRQEQECAKAHHAEAQILELGAQI